MGRVAVSPVRLREVEVEQTYRDTASFWLAALVGSSQNAIIGEDLSGLVTSWNKAAGMIFDYTSEEIIGRSNEFMCPADRINETPLILERVHNGEKIENFETKRQHKDGAIIPLSLTVTPVRDEQGNLIGAAKIASDCRVRDERERQLRQIKSELTAAKAVAAEANQNTARSLKT